MDGRGLHAPKSNDSLPSVTVARKIVMERAVSKQTRITDRTLKW